MQSSLHLWLGLGGEIVSLSFIEIPRYEPIHEGSGELRRLRR